MISSEWFDYYIKKLQENNDTFRPNGINIIEKELKEREYMRRFLDNAYEALEMDITGGLDDDGIWVINIHFKDDTNISIICKDKEEYNFWKEYAGL